MNRQFMVIAILLMSLTFISMTIFIDKNDEVLNNSNFIEKKDVLKLFVTSKESDAKSLDNKSIERATTLIPEKIFFPENLIKDIKSKKSISEQKLDGKDGVDLRSRDLAAVSQWNGTCTAHGLVAAIENMAQNRVKLSERHIWDEYQSYSCDTAIKTWSGTGKCIAKDECWEHDYRAPLDKYLSKECCHTYLKRTTYLDDSIQSAINALILERPVYLATSVSRSMLNCDTAISAKSSGTGGGHALAIVGYVFDKMIYGGGYFIIKNSWGDKCGDKGYQYLPFGHCQRQDFYCLFWSIDDVGVDKNPTPTPEPINRCAEWKRIWWKPWVKKCVLWKYIVD